jgi:hypothetical protein
VTLVVDRRAADNSRPRRPLLRRAWDAPVWAHLAALGIVLLALVPLVGTGSSLSADEGAAIVQARSLARGDGWIVEHPVPEVDPTGAHYPLELTEQGSKGRAPFAKHPAYALLLAGADRVGGTAAMVLLSLGGTLAAAALAAALARRVDPSLSRPTVWVVGLASPLLFDGFLVIAHTLGAAAATAAVLCAVIAVERRKLVLALGVIPCIGLAVLFRNEAVFFALGLATAAGVIAISLRARARLTALAVAAGSVTAAAGAHFGERLWIRRLVGPIVAPIVTVTGNTTASNSGGGGGVLNGRIRAFLLTWLRPGYTGPKQLTLALTVMVITVALGAYAVRRHPGDRRVIVALCSVAAVAAVVALVTKPTNIVPGLLVAFPLMLAGLLLIRRAQLQTTAAQIGAVTFAVFAFAVLATQYTKGGSGEWGGRYFALGLPVLVPVLLLALRDAGRALAPSTRRYAAASLATVTVVMAIMGIASLTNGHRFTADLMADVGRAGHQAAADRPIMITTSPAIPRFAWKTFEDQRWLLTTPEAIDGLLQRLRAAGIERAVLVTNGNDPVKAQLPSDVAIDSHQSPGGGWQVQVLGLGS